MPILGISKLWFNSLEDRFWKFCSTFEIAWAALICVVITFSKSPNMLILLQWSFSYIKWGVLIRFWLNPRNFNPRNFLFLESYHHDDIYIKRCRIFVRIFWYMWNPASCPNTQTPTQMLRNWLTGVQFPGNWVKMIFKSLQLGLFRFLFHSLSSKILKIPGFNLFIWISPSTVHFGSDSLKVILEINERGHVPFYHSDIYFEQWIIYHSISLVAINIS